MRPHRGLVSLRPGEEEEEGSNRRGGQSLRGRQGVTLRDCRGHLGLTQGCPPPGCVQVVDRTEQQGRGGGGEGQALGVKELALIGAQEGSPTTKLELAGSPRRKVRKQIPLPSCLPETYRGRLTPRGSTMAARPQTELRLGEAGENDGQK